MLFHNLGLSALALVMTWSSVAVPASQIGEPRRDYKLADFAKLRWVEGTWQGSGAGYDAFYERYRFVNVSTIEMTSFSDASLKTVSDRATIALRNGRIYDEGAGGKSRYEAARVKAGVVEFVPVRGANNSFRFTRMSKDKWTATLRAPSGKKTVYEMRRK